MQRGPKPKPKAINDLKGDPHGRRSRKTEPEPPKDRPICPDYLDAVAKEEWAFVTDALEKMGILSSADRGVIEFYCEAYSRFRRSEAMIRQYGEVLVSKKTGSMYRSPYLDNMTAAQDRCCRLAESLGLTPVARARLAVTPQDTAPNPFITKFVNRSA